ncbi:nucleotide pyrophosphohydrolase, partial [Candidatus Pacebacteria bacterium]|nr:nucleotide pyrophosphohydrolase [Candidatus Paceibacterota bacterium]
RYKELVARIQKFCDDRDWSQFHDPKNLAISLQLEAAEVLELFQWTKDNQAKPERAENMADELADVMYWLIMLANHYNIDLTEALDRKMDKNETKYPVEKAKGTSAKYTEL